MYLTKKHISRRFLLRGLGIGVALPFLDAMVPAGTALANTVAAPRVRTGFFYLPHGAVMDRWTPAAEGRDFELSPTLKPLEPYRDYLTVISGLDNKPAVSAATHAITPGTWLSCVAPARSPAPFGGVTLDQVLAKHIGQDTLQPSVEAAIEKSGGSAACTGTYGCSFGNTICFSSETTPLPMEFSPRKFFTRLFGRGASEAERQAINVDYYSLLDMVAEETADLKRRLGVQDRVVLTNYLDSVREIERRVANAEAEDLGQYDLPELPAGVPDFDAHLRLMFDMIAVAYQADITRVASFMMAAEVSNHAYTNLEVSDAFHPLSHHNNNPAALEKLARIQHYHTQAFADFLAKLAEMPEGEGNVLDNSMFLYGGNMSDSNRHDHFPLPIAVIGKGAGTIKGNQHLRYEDHTPLANLHLSFLHRAGVEAEAFGDSTGTFSEL